MEKLIEMTVDGRLTLVWGFVIVVLLVVCWELWPWWVAHRRDRNRRISLAKRYGKSARHLR